MVTAGLTLGDEHLAKAVLYMRALRRAVIAFWYATIEDRQAALIEAVQACLVVNILDEAVFQDALGLPYQKVRADHRLGRVVTGLELVRNCETHAPVAFDGLLVERRLIGIAVHGRTIYRLVPAWADYADLPPIYVDLPHSATSNQMRARREAQHGYRSAVAGRSVVETLLDAIAFFQHVEPRLVTREGPALQYAYVELLPDRDPAAGEPDHVLLTRPMGLDTFEVFLPPLATRSTERRAALWPAADAHLKTSVKTAKETAPTAPYRQIQYQLRNHDNVIGYAGVTPGNPAWTWVERAQQVRRDVRGGYRYVAVQGDQQIEVVEHGHQRVAALLADGTDVLVTLPDGDTPHADIARLEMVETYPDLYLDMRHSQ
ncbi:hypothetical protein AB0H83_23560 [Dactylosporangium sp. NPDC050688]|uniref:hypothetical protein n=1 Tax=Dactylosporangium sp. NPDC050688 TaxID=3157217 RepID=UPI0033FF3ED6